jgi:hypothetical protein
VPLLFSFFFFCSWQKVLATPVEQTEMATISKNLLNIRCAHIVAAVETKKKEVTAPGTHTKHMQHVCLSLLRTVHVITSFFSI